VSVVRCRCRRALWIGSSACFFVVVVVGMGVGRSISHTEFGQSPSMHRSTTHKPKHPCSQPLQEADEPRAVTALLLFCKKPHGPSKSVHPPQRK
jgi:hypothetical protein